MIVATRLTFPCVEVTLEVTPTARVFGVLRFGSVRADLTRRQREDLACWRAIQRERRRLGLPPLTAYAMIVG